MNSKAALRHSLREMRQNLPAQRRKEAHENVLADLYPRLASFSYILSFANKKEEINLTSLNALLAKEGRLLLPHVLNEEEIYPYHVQKLDEDLEMHPRWMIQEPSLDRCPPCLLEKIDCVLVPGLGFDAANHRIGFGRGHYDRLLSNLTCLTYGVAFREQLLQNPLPIDPHDISLSSVFFY